MSTRLRTIGRPDELRRTLLRRSLAVSTAVPLARPGEVFGRPGVIRALVTAGADVVSAGEARASLEDVYLELADERPEPAS